MWIREFLHIFTRLWTTKWISYAYLPLLPSNVRLPYPHKKTEPNAHQRLVLNSSLFVLKMIRKVLGSYHPILKTFHMSQTRTFNNGVMMGVVNKKNSHTHTYTHTHTRTHTKQCLHFSICACHPWYWSKVVLAICHPQPTRQYGMGRKKFENAESGRRQYNEDISEFDTKIEISYKPSGL